MSVSFSGQNSGRFVSDGTNKLIPIQSTVSTVEVFNATKATIVPAAGDVVSFYWQEGMANGGGFKETNLVTGTVVSPIAANQGFFLTDTSVNNPGPLTAITTISADPIPLVETAEANLPVPGSIVRIYDTLGALQISSIDFTTGAVDPDGADSTFELVHSAQIAAGTTGNFAVIPYNPMFYPRNRYISSISQATEAVVKFTVQHDYAIGQKIQFIIPNVTTAAFGMTALNDVVASVIDVDLAANTITVDVDTSAMTAFAWPLTANGRFTFAQVVPIGGDNAPALNSGTNPLAYATRNTAQKGILLKGGVGNPGGAANDIIYWRVGSSFN